MTEIEVSFTEKDVAAYDAEVLALQRRFAAFAAPSAVHYSWHPPKLAPDGSLADSDAERAKQEWGAARRPRATTGGTGKQGSW